MATQEAPSTSTDASDRAPSPSPKRQKTDDGDLRVKPPGDNSLKNVVNPVNNGPVVHNPPLRDGFGPSQSLPQTPQPAPRSLTPTNIAARRLLDTPRLNPMAPAFQPQVPFTMDPFRPQHPRTPSPISSQESFSYPPMLNSLGQVCPRPPQQQGPPPQVRSPKPGEEPLGYFTNALHDLAGELTAAGVEVPFSLSDDDLHEHSYEKTWEQFTRDFKANSAAQNTRRLSPSDLHPDLLALFRDKDEYVRKNKIAHEEHFKVPRVAARAPSAAPPPASMARGVGAPVNTAIQSAHVNSDRQQTPGAPTNPAFQQVHFHHGRQQISEGPINPAVQPTSSNGPAPPTAGRHQIPGGPINSANHPVHVERGHEQTPGVSANPAVQPTSSNGPAHPKVGQQQTPADGNTAQKMPPMGHFPTRPAPPPKRKSTKRKGLHEAPASSSSSGAYINGPATGPPIRAQPANPGIGGNTSMANAHARPAATPAPEDHQGSFHTATGLRSVMPSMKTELGLLNTPVDRRISHPTPSPRPAAAQPRPPPTHQPAGVRHLSAAPPPHAQPTAGARQGAEQLAMAPSVRAFMASQLSAGHPPVQPAAGVRHLSAAPLVQSAAGPHPGPRQPFMGPHPPHPDDIILSRSTLNRTLTTLLNARRAAEALAANAGSDPAVLAEQARLVETAVRNVAVAAVDLAQGVRVEEFWPNMNLDLLLQ
ncbi:hypothetical protein CcaCcLH18_12488 [Colletotrichum camelliae]|nr:hypothetical protein CcaCcLH18_12488 [Colletotrichum camelliae]